MSALFSTVLRRATPSLRQQAHTRTTSAAAASHTKTQTAAAAAAAEATSSRPAHSEGEQAIFDKLSERFQPGELLVQDVSGGCGTFYAITIASKAFKGIPVVKQHRLINETLKEEIKGIHGLQLKTVPL